MKYCMIPLLEEPTLKLAYMHACVYACECTEGYEIRKGTTNGAEAILRGNKGGKEGVMEYRGYGKRRR